MAKIRVLIVDDSVVIRRVVGEELAADPGIEVIGTAPNGKIAIAKLPQLAPDLVIQIVSPGDLLSDILALETDYRNIGVPEIVFIDQRRHTVRVLSKDSRWTPDEPEYTDRTLVSGESLSLKCLNDVSLPVDWLFNEPRPTVRTVLTLWHSPTDGR